MKNWKLEKRRLSDGLAVTQHDETQRTRAAIVGSRRGHEAFVSRSHGRCEELRRARDDFDLRGVLLLDRRFLAELLPGNEARYLDPRHRERDQLGREHGETDGEEEYDSHGGQHATGNRNVTEYLTGNAVAHVHEMEICEPVLPKGDAETFTSLAPMRLRLTRTTPASRWPDG